MNTYLNQAYQAGCAQALHDFTKSANWRETLLGGAKPVGRASALSLLLGGVGGAVAAPYLNQDDWNKSTSLSKAWQRFQGGLLGASSALTGHNRFGLAGTLGGMGVGIGANYGLSKLAPTGDSMGSRAGNAALEAIKSSMGASLLANSMFRGGGIRNAIDGLARKQIGNFAESNVRGMENAGRVNFTEMAEEFKKDPDVFRLPESVLKDHGIPTRQKTIYKDSKGVSHDAENVLTNLRDFASAGHAPMRDTTSHKLVEHLRRVSESDNSWARADARSVLQKLEGHGLHEASDQDILRKLHTGENPEITNYSEIGRQLAGSVGAANHDDMLRHFYDTTPLDTLSKKYNDMPHAELAHALRGAHVQDTAAPLYEGLYEQLLMGAVDAGGPGKWIADLRGTKQGPVSKGIDYWLGSPEVAALVKEHGGLHNVPAGKYISSMAKDIGVGSAIALGAAPIGAAYGAVSDAMRPEEPWYSKHIPYKIVQEDQ